MRRFPGHKYRVVNMGYGSSLADLSTKYFAAHFRILLSWSRKLTPSTSYKVLFHGVVDLGAEYSPSAICLAGSLHSSCSLEPMFSRRSTRKVKSSCEIHRKVGPADGSAAVNSPLWQSAYAKARSLHLLTRHSYPHIRLGESCCRQPNFVRENYLNDRYVRTADSMNNYET